MFMGKTGMMALAFRGGSAAAVAKRLNLVSLPDIFRRRGIDPRKGIAPETIFTKGQPISTPADRRDSPRKKAALESAALRQDR